LQELFERYGEVSSANIVTERETGRSRGFGFVEMPDDTAATNAIDALNDTEFEGKRITVNEARPKTDRDDRRGSNRGGGGYGRGGNGGGYDRGGNGGGYNRGGGHNKNRY
jgi:RNA recognition motif-containing protein